LKKNICLYSLLCLLNDNLTNDKFIISIATLLKKKYGNSKTKSLNSS